MSVLDILAKKGIIEAKEVDAIKQRAKTTGASIDSLLLEMGVSDSDILANKGEYYSIPVKSVDESLVTGKILEYIPEESASYYKFVPVALIDGVLEIGIVDPDNIAARDAISFIASKSNLPYKVFLISQSDFDKVLKMYKGLSREVTKALSELENEFVVESGKRDDDEEEGKKKVVKEEKSEETEDLSAFDNKNKDTKTVEDAPVTKIVATVLRYAIDGRASDIHIEPMEASVKVRFRVDGVMNTSLVLPFRVHSAVVARIKIMSNMRLDEKRKPQDGRFSARLNERKIDFRVSTFPTYFGEKVVIRILDQEKGIRKLSELGLSKGNLEKIMNAINQPYGLILISGPTGSGKSTTLYSMLNEVDKDHKNVLSLEDPIEYNMEGMSQSQVRADIGYTFASGLR